MTLHPNEAFLKEALGFRVLDQRETDEETRRRRQRINLLLVANGLQPACISDDSSYNDDAERLMASYHRRLKLLDEVRCPVDRRIEAFLESHFRDEREPLKLPPRTIILDQHGLAREMSLPIDGDSFTNGLLTSYRVRNGVLHNPLHDRRTTQGTFHICEGGLSIPADKVAVPKAAFAALFRAAMQAPANLLKLPFTSTQADPAHCFVSLLIRPLVCPEVPGATEEKRMECRFFAPGGLVSNLDFVESIFGNGGDPFQLDNDAGLDVKGWTGHTGCVILAPHLIHMTKQELGLPHVDEATPRQKRDGMCWRDAGERYNGGTPFKATCRTDAGVIITLIADNYFGYCKKEVKTQISYAANLFGNVEEEHAGGALAFASFSLGEEFEANSRRYNGRSFADVVADYGEWMDVHPQGYATDKKFPNLFYIPEDARASLQDQQVQWRVNDKDHHIPLLPGNMYMTPSGYKLHMEKHPEAPSWRLIGTMGEGVVCHKPCTVSGGGKSEISKSISDYKLYGPIFVSNLEGDLALVEDIFTRDYSRRWREDMNHRPDYEGRLSRSVLDPHRSLGSVIKLLTPSADYSPEYMAWLHSIPSHIYAIVFIIKRFQQSGDWANSWKNHFSVDIVNGDPGHELRYNNRKLVGSYLRVGLEEPNRWRTYKLRQDFAASTKLQLEDDISVSVVVPREKLHHLGLSVSDARSYKFVQNCEYRLFQRPDDAIHRGLDRQAEADLAQHDNFISNFEPLSHEQVAHMCKYVVDLDKFTRPMQALLQQVAQQGRGYVVCSSTPRLVDGRPTKNPRYLQARPDLVYPLTAHIAEIGTRLVCAVPPKKPVHLPVNSVLLGRRNNPPEADKGIRSLAVYNPIHYQELPELFMDFVSSLTGKSPSTTGAGSEGALTKGPFNALLPIVDLNNALVSFILTDLHGFSTAAGHIGPQLRVDHDISYLVPEIWCRLLPEDRDPKYLIRKGMLEPLEDFEHDGKRILASRLGYRITSRFVRWFFGRVFDNPSKVFDEAILKPETQDPVAFADGVQYITEAHQRIAAQYFEDGSIELACPPLKSLLTIMARGDDNGITQRDPELRKMFTLPYLLDSDWYRERLLCKQDRDVQLWKRHLAYLDQFLDKPQLATESQSLQLRRRREWTEQRLNETQQLSYLEHLVGTLGAHPGPM